MAGLRVQVHRFYLKHLDICLLFEHGTQGRGDFGGRKPAGRHLIEQGLEEMEVAPVHQGHLQRGAALCLSGVETTKAAADDDHVMPVMLRFPVHGIPLYAGI